MARSRRNEANRLSASVEAGLLDLAEIIVSEAAPNGESGAAFETLNLGHGSLRNECWSGASAAALGSYRGDSVAPRPATRRLRRPPRRRTQLHSVRPLQAAEARFTSDYFELLTC
jgi:hypothetical protein